MLSRWTKGWSLKCACRSVCNQDQKGTKQSSTKIQSRVQIKVTLEWQKPMSMALALLNHTLTGKFGYNDVEKVWLPFFVS